MDYITVDVNPKGLGNILFAGFAGFIVSKKKNLKLKIYLPGIGEHNINNFDYYDIFFKKFATRISTLEGNQRFFVPALSMWDPEKVKAGFIMDSHFQYYPPFKPYESDIRSIVLEALEPYRQEISAKIDVKNRIFLHIRRGDYLLFPGYWFIPSDNYYKRSIQVLKPIKPIIIVSNDNEWVKNHEYFGDTRYFEIFEGNELESLALMSLCTEGAIIANSTFSWWGAFLGAHSERNKVIVPSHWVQDNIHGLFPEEWITVNST
jgi:hypothetical protein